MTLFDKLNDLWDAVVEWFEEIGDDVMDFMKPLAKQIAISGKGLLAEIAMEAVRAAEATGKPGTEKLEYAYEYAEKRLKEDGKEFIVNALFGALISAVAILQNEQAGNS